MKNDLKKLILILLLKAGPQDLAYSLSLLWFLLLAYVISGLLILQTTVSPDNALLDIGFGLLVQAVFCYAVLNALGLAPRFVQTCSALVGVGMLLNLLAWPVFALLADEGIGEGMKNGLSLVFLLLISWEILAKARIFMHALEMRMAGAMALSFALFFIGITLSQLLFPAAPS